MILITDATGHFNCGVPFLCKFFNSIEYDRKFRLCIPIVLSKNFIQSRNSYLVVSAFYFILFTFICSFHLDWPSRADAHICPIVTYTSTMKLYSNNLYLKHVYTLNFMFRLKLNEEIKMYKFVYSIWKIINLTVCPPITTNCLLNIYWRTNSPWNEINLKSIANYSSKTFKTLRHDWRERITIRVCNSAAQIYFVL